MRKFKSTRQAQRFLNAHAAVYNLFTLWVQAIVQAAAKNIKTEEDLNFFRQMLTRITV
jgi:hypothetical protein